MPDPETCFAAVRTRDPAADGRFVYAVATTGVFCRPSCAARPARRENLSFHPDPDAARRAGFRPCKRCRPDEPPRLEREAALVAVACRTLDTAAEPPGLETLAAAAELSPHHFHRMFRRIVGVTPGAYAAAGRQARVQAGLAAGASVTEALYHAGFNSAGRFYEAAPAMLGMAPARFRAGAPSEAISFATGACSLGTVLVATAARGVCAILLGDDATALEADLRRRFARATVTEADSATLQAVIAAVDHPETPATLPLDIRGTAFQRRVWEVLRAIPPGETLSYGQVAARIGAPAASRAVAGACAANPLAVAVPCHRVVAADGSIGGYRWGPARKRALLDSERRRS